VVEESPEGGGGVGGSGFKPKKHLLRERYGCMTPFSVLLPYMTYPPPLLTDNNLHQDIDSLLHGMNCVTYLLNEVHAL